jgi:hypothetical protein
LTLAGASNSLSSLLLLVTLLLKAILLLLSPYVVNVLAFAGVPDVAIASILSVAVDPAVAYVLVEFGVAAVAVVPACSRPYWGGGTL